MSTLGDLLAEHTVLPGNAVDHLHAVVGEWQLLADLSFADYLMWVCRDDGVLVCVAQVRPNTAPTVLLADAVGSLADAEQMPLMTAMRSPAWITSPTDTLTLLTVPATSASTGISIFIDSSSTRVSPSPI